MPKSAVVVTVTGLTGARGNRLVGSLYETKATRYMAGYSAYAKVGMFEADIDADPYSTTQSIRPEKTGGFTVSLDDEWPWLLPYATELPPGKYTLYISVGRRLGSVTDEKVAYECRMVITKVRKRAATATVGPLPLTEGVYLDPHAKIPRCPKP